MVFRSLALVLALPLGLPARGVAWRPPMALAAPLVRASGPAVATHADGDSIRATGVPSGGGMPAPVDFGTVPIGICSRVLAVPVTFTAQGCLGEDPAATTQGMPDLDFKVVEGGSLARGMPHGPGSIGTVNVVFTPRGPGTRYGAVNLVDSDRTLAATVFLQGTGSGPQAAFLPGTVRTTALDDRTGPLAVDAAGTLYVSDSGLHTLFKETPSRGTYQETEIATFPDVILSAALDGSGGLYVVTQFTGGPPENPQLQERIERLAFSGGTCTRTEVTRNLWYRDGAVSVAVDGGGNLYICQKGAVVKQSCPGGTHRRTTVISGLDTAAEHLAVDGNGNLYFCIGNDVLKETYRDGSYVRSTVVTGLDEDIMGMALDATGSLYLALAHSLVKETLKGGVYTPTKLADRPGWPVCVDGRGNAYYFPVGSPTLAQVDLADPPSLDFGTLAVGSTSPGQNVTLWNRGNADLIFPVPATGTNPAISGPGFALDPVRSCPLVVAGSYPGLLAAGDACTLMIGFTPASQGVQSGLLTIQDNHLNTAAPGHALQTIALKGVGDR